MDFNYDEKTDTVQCIAYKGSDICCECKEEIRNSCPLLICISNNYVYPCAGEMQMSSCKLYDLLNNQQEDIEEPS